jgi:hypothetical protein
VTSGRLGKQGASLADQPQRHVHVAERGAGSEHAA